MQSLCIKRSLSTINMLFFALALLLLLKFLWVAFFLCHPIYFNHNDYNDSINNNNNHNDKSN